MEKTIETFYVKIIQFDLDSGKTEMFYIGKDGYVHEEHVMTDGWTKRRFAEDYIERDMKSNDYREINSTALKNRNCIYKERWLLNYSVESHIEKR